ncbi:T9SS type B sorting domain-containing protein [Maribacter sp. BPC-D8]|uniref:T9SS type B sorting domain-containing protein n=1 Tax=Maribacter sp. BPC-D8 TaxID=3053613 RepID=UPI002B45EB33|nr:T9SS type B sorting domain-containing protein [Maribacter sp. BPC-D8]WRI29107.1 T9SS type B sorting domain-containing protein [Maribacter sp. BPC-D8]
MMYSRFFLLTILLTCCGITSLHAQLGFCGGNSGDPIFTEDFGSGTTDGPALPAGTTTYNFTTGTPNDGDYTISSSTNYYDWLSIEDHTPGDSNGKSFIVNASFTAGEFYQRQVTGLCENTTYEFSSWLINLQIAGSCEGNSIPVNVRFQIWDQTDTNMLAQGDTGSISGIGTTVWEQYALIFKTAPGQTSVILKMRNNSNGGCGNDLAIDDILFRSCGDNVTIATAADEASLVVCADQGSVSRTLTATPDASVFSTHAYQWQQSTDQQIWTDIPGENSAILNTPAVTATTYFRTKIAEDIANVNNDLCNVVSDVFDITVLPIPPAPTNNGDVTICEGELGTLSVNTQNAYSINWYDAATGGNLILSDNRNLEIDIAGTYYAEANSTEIECASTTRTAVTLTVNPLPVVPGDISTFLCEDSSTTLDAEVENAMYQWSTGATTQTIDVTEPGDYDVSITNANGCSAKRTFTVEQIDLPRIDKITSDGPSIVVSTSNNGNFEYSLDGISFQSSNIFEAVEGGFYTIYVQDNTDCGVVTQDFYHLVIQKFFTPNGDSYNDIFEPDGLEVFNTVMISIFDRYGKLLKFGNTNSTSWDGTFQGERLPEDDYWYLIEADSTQFKGHFSLKR